MVKVENSGQTPTAAFALPQMHELRHFRSSLPCAGKGVSADMNGAVALLRILLKASRHQRPGGVDIVRTRIQESNGFALTCTRAIVMELRVVSEDRSKLFGAAGDECGVEERGVHAGEGGSEPIAERSAHCRLPGVCEHLQARSGGIRRAAGVRSLGGRSAPLVCEEAGNLVL
jgi:hypothetical protein